MKCLCVTAEFIGIHVYAISYGLCNVYACGTARICYVKRPSVK